MHAPHDTIQIASRIELFVDYHLIDRLENARLQMHAPRPENVAIVHDSPWEDEYAGLATVLHDRGRFHLYYRANIKLHHSDGTPVSTTTEQTGYAFSDDGVTFTKPALGLCENKGSKANAIILDRPDGKADSFAPFLDTRPGVPAEERFKAIGGSPTAGLNAWTSGDGVHWRLLSDAPLITSEKFAFDSQNVAFWSEHEQKYVLYFRVWKGFVHWGQPGHRWIARSTSGDFVHWSAPEEMTAGDRPDEHLYTSQTTPYFRAPHIYIALAARFWPGKSALTPEQVRSTGIARKDFGNDCSDTVLLTSRGGTRFDRTFMESFVRPGPGYRNWGTRSNYSVRGIVANPSKPGEISLYFQRRLENATPCIERYSLRQDGFVSVNAPYDGGELVTRPLVFNGRRLVLNYATSAAGSIAVELRDAEGSPIPGFGIEDALPCIGDEVERTVAWRSGADVSALAGKPVRIRFVMKDADLYSIRFME